MKEKVHQIKIDFHVTEQIARFVYVYIIEAEHLYLIDSGVFGCETQIADYLKSIGRNVSEVKGIFLTHAHPDHIGSASWFQEHTGCKVYASEGEKRWIEDIDLQYRERPIPNFHRLAGKSTRVDVTIKDGDVIPLEEGLSVTVFRTAGHSQDGVSYLAGRRLFIGDTVPVKDDIPIFIDEQEQRKTLEILGNIPNVDEYCPAWDRIYSKELMNEKLQEATALLDTLKNAVVKTDDGTELSLLTEKVCAMLQMPMLKENPLFQRTVACLRKEA